MKTALAVFTMLLVSTTCHAQVWKCKNEATGKVEYSGTPCNTTSSGKTINAAPNEIDASGGRELVQRAQARDAAEALEREMAAAQRAATERTTGGSNANSACSSAEREYQAAKSKQAPPSTMQPLKNKVQSACGRAPSGSTPRNTPSPGGSPSVITNCDAAGCWDNLGGRYNKGAGSTYFPASGGGACQLVAGQMQCP